MYSLLYLKNNFIIMFWNFEDVRLQRRNLKTIQPPAIITINNSVYFLLVQTELTVWFQFCIANETLIEYGIFRNNGLN